MTYRKAVAALGVLVLTTVPVRTAGAAGSPVAESEFPEVAWRLVGPYRGGWSTMVVGVPSQPDTYYAGTAGGGVWKTDDSGRSWRAVSDGAPITAVGALAVAASDPNVLYAGTGHPEPRYDIIAGTGVYRSRDAGKSWQSAGLGDSRHVGALLVDPRDANVVLAAVQGHMFGPNAERGVFRSEDGGVHWARTLFVDAQTGAVDLAADPADPRLIYAVTWTARAWPWLSYFTPIEGPGSAIHRSTDGGRSWTRLAGAGWPIGDLGRIGIAVTHAAGATRLYASIESHVHGGLYRSDDGGAHWLRVNVARWSTSYYASRLTVSPVDPDVVYTVGQSLRESRDAGRSFSIIRGAPGGDDFHYLWINPHEPQRMAAGTDQGATVTVNGGASWSDWYNQPTGQFYYLATDDRFPYWIYSGQQDSGTVAIASRGDYGGIGLRDWHPVGGEERDYDLPDPTDPNIVYGSGLGGRVSRWDARTGAVQNVSPWPVPSYGKRPTDFRYHYGWFTPLAFEKHAPYALYAGAQVLFRSLDRGAHWEVISPELGRRDLSVTDCGGDLGPARAAACGYGVVNTIAPSPRDPSEIWVGTDDGRVWLTRDRARTWRDVSPPAATTWVKISSLEVAAPRAGVAYLALDNHRQDDFAPRVLKTADFGATWTDLTANLPPDQYVSVVRADPVRAGLLYAGTSGGVQVSFDDGGHWQSLQRNLPPVWVHDLLVKDRDLIAATNGRALWVLDDLSPLRQVVGGDGAVARLYAPAPAWRLRVSHNRDSPLTPETPLGRNPPTGAVIDYWLAAGVHGPVELEARDASGRLVRHFSSADRPPALYAERYFAGNWLRPESQLSAEPGAHRFVWDLRYPRPKAIEFSYSIAGSPTEGTPLVPDGPLAPPGKYRLTLRAGGQRFEAPLSITADPRGAAAPADFAAAFEFAVAVGTDLERAWRGYAEAAMVRQELAVRRAALGPDPQRAALASQIAQLDAELAPLLAGDGEQARSLRSAGKLLASVQADVDGSDRAPTKAQREVAALAGRHITEGLGAWSKLRSGALMALNRALAAQQLTPIEVPDAAELHAEPPEGGEDVP